MILINYTPFVLWTCVRVLVTMHTQVTWVWWSLKHTRFLQHKYTPHFSHTVTAAANSALSSSVNWVRSKSKSLSGRLFIVKFVVRKVIRIFTTLRSQCCVKLPPVSANSIKMLVPNTFPWLTGCLASLSLNNSAIEVFGQGQMTSCLWRNPPEVQSGARFSVLQEGREQLSSAQFTGWQD